MKLHLRILAAGVGVVLLAAACGAGTGEGTATVAPVATAAPATQAQAATPAPAAKPQFLVIVGDTIRGKLGLNPVEVLLAPPGLHCTQQNRFPQGQRIVWRMKVIDPANGKYLDDKQISSFTITFPDGKSDVFKYGEHKGATGSDFLWAAGYTVPIDYPTGLFNVKIEAKDLEGRVGVFDQFKVSFAQLTIVPVGKDYPESHSGK